MRVSGPVRPRPDLSQANSSKIGAGERREVVDCRVPAVMEDLHRIRHRKRFCQYCHYDICASKRGGGRLGMDTDLHEPLTSHFRCGY